MISFLLCLAILIGGYFVYGKIVDNTFGPDDRETPAVRINDGVDYVVMPQWKLFLVQLLNIAGLGPIFGALQGALWGPVVFLWITFGTIFAGAVHDYFSGMMSERNEGASISERETWNMDPAALRRAFALHGTPKAVVVVHLYGNPAKLDEITAICREHGVPLIEDAAEALGSTYNGQKCGTFGDFGALSFNGNKIITTSGGGMLLCRTEDEAKHALKLSTQARENAPWYQHEEIGYNYRMSNICAGIGRGQMKVLPLRVEQKRAIFARYCENLKGLPLTMQPELPCAESNRWLSVALLDKGCNVTPGEMLTKLNEVGIEGRYLWKPMHLQPVFANCPFVSVSDAPVGDDLFARGVCLPSDTKMSTDDVDRVCDTIRGMF